MKEKICDLKRRLDAVKYEWTRVSAKMWSPEQWKDSRNEYNRVLIQLQALIPARISELELEREKLQKANPRRWQYNVVGEPESYIEAQQQIMKIAAEIAMLEWYRNQEVKR